GVDEEVERAGDGALGRVLDRHDTHIRLRALDGKEDVRHRRCGQVVDAVSELPACSEMCERGRGAEEAHAQPLLERPAGGDDLAEDGPDRLGLERAGSGVHHALDDLLLARRVVHGRRAVRLLVADLLYEARTRVEQGEEAIVDAIDPPPQRLDRGGARHGRSADPLAWGCRICNARVGYTCFFAPGGVHADRVPRRLDIFAASVFGAALVLTMM